MLLSRVGDSRLRRKLARLRLRKPTRQHKSRPLENLRRARMFHHLLCHHLLWELRSHFQWETLKLWSQEKVKLWKQSQHSKWEMCPRWKLILFGWSLGREHLLEEWIELWGEQLMKHSRAWVPGSQIAIKDQVLRRIQQALSLWAWFLEKIVKGEKSVTERDHHLLKKELVKLEWMKIEIEVKMAVKKEGMITVESDSCTRRPVLIQKWISSAKEKTPKQLWMLCGQQWTVELPRHACPWSCAKRKDWRLRAPQTCRILTQAAYQSKCMGFAIPRSPLEIRMDPRWLELVRSRQWTLPNHYYQWRGL